jgi:hypothetical protein
MGTHEELMSQKGFYSNLLRLQESENNLRADFASKKNSEKKNKNESYLSIGIFPDVVLQ